MLSPPLKIGVWNAWIFMSVFIIQMAIILFASNGVWERSHVSNDMRKTILEKNIGIIANIFWLMVLGYSVFLPLLLGTPWFSIGLFVYLIGVFFLVWATINFMAAPVDKIIQKGAYNFSRHPMYLATFLICLGSGIATASIIFIVLSVLMGISFHFEALCEERCCLELYKDSYQNYMKRVPRWLGFIKE